MSLDKQVRLRRSISWPQAIAEHNAVFIVANVRSMCVQQTGQDRCVLMDDNDVVVTSWTEPPKPPLTSKRRATHLIFSSQQS
jgi:hypothetical protein